MKPLEYGGVMIDFRGRVLLCRPADPDDENAWTFPTRPLAPRESPMQAGNHVVEEFTGVFGQDLGRIPGAFEGPGEDRIYFLLRVAAYHGNQFPDADATVWATPDAARDMIEETITEHVRERDLAVLEAALALHATLHS
jgi:ADP-ribose pyrophosphatase YjhB (NUDIX family)